MDSESLARLLQDFLSGSRDVVVLEDDSVIFDLSQAKYSVAAEYGKCLLQFWSAESNVVRRVIQAAAKGGVLRLSAQRLGQTRASNLGFAGIATAEVFPSAGPFELCTGASWSE